MLMREREIWVKRERETLSEEEPRILGSVTRKKRGTGETKNRISIAGLLGWAQEAGLDRDTVEKDVE